MKITNFKKYPLLIAVSIFLALSGCDGTTGITSDSGIGAETPASVQPVYDTNTSALIGDGSTTFSNSTRNVVTDNNGYIYVAYHGTNGIYVSMSKDSGTTFTTPIQISPSNQQVSIAVSNNGTVYVAWLDAGSVFLSRSLDGGVTYTIPVNLGSLGGGSGIHMDTDGSNIYILQQGGAQVAYSNDNGENFSLTAIGGAAFSDVRVDKNNHYVYVTTDNPTIVYYVSTDFGDTFSSAVIPGGDIFYSTTAISSGINGRYIFVSGSGTDAYRIDLDTETSTHLVFGQNTTSQGRSLSADSLGNLVDGYPNGTSVYFAISYNLGNTFLTAIEVDVDSSDISVTIDPVNNKVVVAYHKQGQVYVKTYAGLLL